MKKLQNISISQLGEVYTKLLSVLPGFASDGRKREVYQPSLREAGKGRGKDLNKVCSTDTEAYQFRWRDYRIIINNQMKNEFVLISHSL
jgi:hypothetical protein